MGGRAPLHYDGDLRQVLLDAAAAEIAEHGTADVSLRAIARRAGVSHAAPAHHFSDKGGLFTALAVRGFADLGAALTAAVATLPPGAPAAERVLAGGLAYVEFALGHPALFDVMWRPALHHADDPELLAMSQAALGLLLAQVGEAQAEGWAADREPFPAAVLLWTVLHGLAVLWRDGPLAEEAGGRSAQDLAREVGGLLVDALGRRAQAGEIS